MIAILFVFTVIYQLDERIQNIQVAEQSDPVWVASQLQFELLRLKNELGKFALGYGVETDIGFRLDIAWSRVSVLKQGSLPQVIETFDVNADVVRDLEATFRRIEPAIAGLVSDSLSIEQRRASVEEILRQLDGYDLSIRDFLVELAQAKSAVMADVRTGLLSLSHAIAYLGATVLILLAIFVFILLLDLSAAKQAENKMRKLADEASSAARMKTNFMSVISHELRTPLTSILGGLALLKFKLNNTLVDETTIKLLDVASRNGDRLLELINNILDAQALSESRVTVVQKPVDLNEVAASAVEDCEAYANRFGVTYRLTTATETVEVLTDRGRVSQILINLISNAAKFTPSGGSVDIRVLKVGKQARVEVIDEGIGIPHHLQGSIFSPFYQVNPGTTGATKSSGLGLSISKQLIDLLDGEIGFNSTQGQGSIFWIELPWISQD
ncbi:two-component hybrid sensor and regulator [Roseovarius sp. 217]|nr:two-component hybrid sensor and regulator [Roseovarius sp. 217]